MIKIGARCRIINAIRPQNENAEVIVTGDAGIRSLRGYPDTQCYYVDREFLLGNGQYRNWTTEAQLEPIDDLSIEENIVDFAEA